MGNSNPARITEAMWWLWEQLHAMEPTSQLGGIYANTTGYHQTRDGNPPGNYSIIDSEDRGGPGDKAAALDWTFPEAQRGDYRRIAMYSKRLLDSGRDMNDTRLDGWREFFGQADWDRDVEGWDYRYVEPSTSDSSHLWHIHFSEDRDKTESLDNKKNLLSVLRGQTLTQWQGQDHEEENMPVFDREQLQPGFATDAAGNITNRAKVSAPVVPPVEGGALPWGPAWISFGCDFGAAKIRIAIHNGQWTIHVKEFTSAMSREQANIQLPANTGKISIARMPRFVGDTDEDVPVSWLLEYGKR